MKPKLTAAEHVELGAALSEVRDVLIRGYAQVANAYPQNTAQAKRLKAAYEALDDARSALDGAMAREHPEQFSPRVYYPRAGGAA